MFQVRFLAFSLLLARSLVSIAAGQDAKPAAPIPAQYAATLSVKTASLPAKPSASRSMSMA